MSKEKKEEEVNKKEVDSVSVKELRDFLNTLPKEFDDYGLVNGEYGNANDETYFRIDKPIIFLTVDEDTEELCLLHQNEKDIKTIIENEKEETIETKPSEDDKDK